MGHVPEFRRGLLPFLSRCAREYGDIVPLRFGPTPLIFLNHPQFVENMLAKNHMNFARVIAPVIHSVLGDGLLTSQEHLWQRRRRLIQPAFHRELIATYASVVVAHTLHALASWQDGDVRDLHQEMMHLTLQVVAKSLFGTELAAEISALSDALSEVMVCMNDRLFSLLSLLSSKFPTPTGLRLRRAIQRLDATIYAAIDERRASTEDRGDLLSMLLLQQRDDEGISSDRHVRDEIITLFLSGSETTAVALSWTWYLLSQHPDVETRLLAELDAVLAERLPTAADVPHLDYTDRVVTESLRLYPPSIVIVRRAIEDCDIDGYRIPSGRISVVSQWVMHRDPRFYVNPEEFNPDRWTKGRIDSLPRYAYFPFGGGPHFCIGNAFAKMEMTLILATIVPRFRLTVQSEQPIEPQGTTSLRPKHGMRMFLRKR